MFRLMGEVNIGYVVKMYFILENYFVYLYSRERYSGFFGFIGFWVGLILFYNENV